MYKYIKGKKGKGYWAWFIELHWAFIDCSLSITKFVRIVVSGKSAQRVQVTASQIKKHYVLRKVGINKILYLFLIAKELLGVNTTSNIIRKRLQSTFLLPQIMQALVKNVLMVTEK